jgi:hypothetical protein
MNLLSSASLRTCHEVVLRNDQICLNLFLTSTLVGANGQFEATAALPLVQEPSSPLNRRLGGPRLDMLLLEKSEILQNQISQ